MYRKGLWGAGGDPETSSCATGQVPSMRVTLLPSRNLSFYALRGWWDAKGKEGWQEASSSTWELSCHFCTQWHSVLPQPCGAAGAALTTLYSQPPLVSTCHIIHISVRADHSICLLCSCLVQLRTTGAQPTPRRREPLKTQDYQPQRAPEPSGSPGPFSRGWTPCATLHTVSFLLRIALSPALRW